MKLIASVIGRRVVDATVHNVELPVSDTQEKLERFDVNCKIDDGSQVNLEMQASRMEEDQGGKHENLKNKVIESEEVLTVASNLLMNISQDERERAIFRSRKKYQMDIASDMATVRDRTLLEVAQNLLRSGDSIEKIVDVTGLTREEIESQRVQYEIALCH